MSARFLRALRDSAHGRDDVRCFAFALVAFDAMTLGDMRRHFLERIDALRGQSLILVVDADQSRTNMTYRKLPRSLRSHCNGSS